MYVRSLQGSSSFNFSVLRRDSFFRMQFYKFIELNCHFVCFAVFNKPFKSQKCLRDSQRVFPAKTISTTLNIDLFKVPAGVKPAFPITASALKKINEPKCGKFCSWLGTTINFCQDITHRLSCIFLQNKLFLRIWYKTSSNHFSFVRSEKRDSPPSHRIWTHAYDNIRVWQNTDRELYLRHRRLVPWSVCQRLPRWK